MNVMCFSISLSGTVTYPSNKRKFQGEMFTMQGFRPWLLFLSFSGHLRIFKLASEELRFWMWTAEKDKTCVGKWLGTSWYDLGVMAFTPVDIILCRSSEGDIYVFFIETVEADMMVGRVEQWKEMRPDVPLSKLGQKTWISILYLIDSRERLSTW